jgi:hypothetical protein
MCLSSNKSLHILSVNLSDTTDHSHFRHHSQLWWTAAIWIRVNHNTAKWQNNTDELSSPAKSVAIITWYCAYICGGLLFNDVLLMFM